LTIGGRAYLQNNVRTSQRSRLREFIDDEAAPSPGLQFKKKNGGRKGGDYTDIDNGIDSDPEFQGGRGELEMGRYTDTL
jgi:hypothetical protein